MCHSLSRILLVGTFVGVSVLMGCTSASTTRTPAVINAAKPLPEEKPSGAAEALPAAQAPADWGIELMGVRLAAAGFMIDFRYRVTEPDLAGPLVDRTVKPYVIDQATGATMSCPVTKVGPARQISREPIKDRTYSIVFANPGRHIKAGNKVTVSVGDVRFENLVVE